MVAQPKDVRSGDPQLDDIDRTLLRLLQTDARMPNSELAVRAGIAASTCHGRLRRLVDLGVIRDGEGLRHGSRRIDLARVPLAVADGQREQPVSVCARDRGGGVRIEAATQQDDGIRHRE